MSPDAVTMRMTRRSSMASDSVSAPPERRQLPPNSPMPAVAACSCALTEAAPRRRVLLVARLEAHAGRDHLGMRSRMLTQADLSDGLAAFGAVVLPGEFPAGAADAGVEYSGRNVCSVAVFEAMAREVLLDAVDKQYAREAAGVSVGRWRGSAGTRGATCTPVRPTASLMEVEEGERSSWTRVGGEQESTSLDLSPLVAAALYLGIAFTTSQVYRNEGIHCTRCARTPDKHVKPITTSSPCSPRARC